MSRILLMISAVSLLCIPQFSHSEESGSEIRLLRSESNQEKLGFTGAKGAYLAAYCFDNKVFVASHPNNQRLSATPFLIDSDTGLNQASCSSKGLQEIATITHAEMKAQKGEAEPPYVFCVTGKKFYKFSAVYIPPIQAIQNGKTIDC